MEASNPKMLRGDNVQFQTLSGTENASVVWLWPSVQYLPGGHEAY